jgi:hypothetical protein
MKKILITYEASIETGDKLEYGEAATTLDFITDDMAVELVDTIGKPYHSWKPIGRVARSRVTEILINLERLRGRIYVVNSIKSVEIIDGEGVTTDENFT